LTVFGGKRVADLPSTYFGWMIDAVEPTPSTRALLAAARAELRRRGGIDDTRASRPTDRVAAALQPMALEIIEAGVGRFGAATHPDHGGDRKSMMTLLRARAVLRIAAVAA
jgi:hypothetical protein